MNSKQKIIESFTPLEQRVFIKFCAVLKHSSGVIHDNLKKCCGGNAFSLSNVKKLLTKFRSGDPSIEDGRGGDRSDQEKRNEVLEQIENLMDGCRQYSIRQISQLIDCPKSTVAIYIKDKLGYKKKLGKWVPHELTEIQKENRVLTCKVNLNEFSKHPRCLMKTLTIDETWVSLYMQPQRGQSRHWLKEGEPLPITVSQNIHGRKRMLILAMDYHGIVFWELIGVGETVNAERYKKFLDEYIPIWLQGKSFHKPLLLHDNARPHKAKVVTEHLEEKGISVWHHPAYSPDISPCDFNCFGQLKFRLRGIDHGDWAIFETNLRAAILALNAENKMKGIQSLPERWQRIIDAKGDYI